MSIDSLISKYYFKLTATDIYIAGLVLNNKNDFINLNINELSKKYSISISSITRFSKKLNLSGFKELKSLMRFESMSNQNSPSQAKEDLINVYKENIKNIRKKDIDNILLKINKAEKIIIIGQGIGELLIVSEMKRIFLSCGKNIINFILSDHVKDLVNSKDLVFFISKEGSCRSFNNYCKYIKSKGAFTVSITNLLNNNLSKICDENIFIANNSRDLSTIASYILYFEFMFLKYKLKFMY